MSAKLKTSLPREVTYFLEDLRENLEAATRKVACVDESHLCCFDRERLSEALRCLRRAQDILYRLEEMLR